MSSEDRIKTTLSRFGASVPASERDLAVVMAKGLRYRRRAKVLTTSLGVLAAAGAIATTAFLFNAFRTGHEPAQPVPLPTITTTTAPPSTTMPAVTTTSAIRATSTTTASISPDVPPVLVIDEEGAAIVDAGEVRPMVIGRVLAAYPDGDGGVVVQPSGDASSALFWIRAGVSSAEQLAVAGEGEVISLLDVAVVDGSPAVLYRVDYPSSDPYYALLRILYLDDRHESTWGQIAGPVFEVVSLSAGGQSIAADFESDRSRSVEMWSTSGGQAAGVFDPDGGSAGAACAEGVCNPVLSSSGDELGFVEGADTLVVVDSKTGDELVRTPIGSDDRLVDVDAHGALVVSDGELLYIDYTSAGISPVAGAEAGVISAAFSPVTDTSILPVQVDDLVAISPVPDEPSLPDGVSLLVAHSGGLSLMSSQGSGPLLSGEFELAIPDGDGGAIAQRGDTIVWLPAAGGPVDVASASGLTLLAVMPDGGEFSVL